MAVGDEGVAGGGDPAVPGGRADPGPVDGPAGHIAPGRLAQGGGIAGGGQVPEGVVGGGRAGGRHRVRAVRCGDGPLVGGAGRQPVQGGEQSGTVGGQERGPVAVVVAGAGEGVGEVGEADVRTGGRAQPAGEFGGPARDGLGPAAGQRYEHGSAGVRRGGRRERRCLLHDDVGVGAAESEGTDRGAAGRPPVPGSARASVATVNGPSSKGMRGLRVVQCSEGGTWPVRTTPTALSRPASPAAAEVWPTLPLTEPIGTLPAGRAAGANASLSAVTSMGSPSGVPVPWHST